MTSVRWADAVLVVGIGLVAWSAPAASGGIPGSPAARIHLGIAPPSTNYTTTRIYYSSSVDGFNLSFEETLPAPFNASRTYPLAIELHGLTGETIPVWGGLPSYVVPTTATAAVHAGFILVNPNTRTGSGWYVDSNFTGPQEQDILDALAVEKSRHHVGAVFLFGESMGSIGTLEIGLDHPNLFRGLGAIASFSDFFEMFAYLRVSFAWITSYMLLPTGGHFPNATAYSRGVFYHLSSLRFHPANASGLRVYVANGAQDVLASNNLSLWPYQQENNTIVNRTCLVAATYHEPAGCTEPLSMWAAAFPARFSYRYVFEPNGPHDYYLMNASDMFAYFLGGRASGTYWGHWPIPSPAAPPQPLVSVVTEPFGCGRVTIGNLTLRTGDAPSLPLGNYSASFSPCGHRTVGSVRVAGGLTYFAATGGLRVSGSGSLVVRFS